MEEHDIIKILKEELMNFDRNDYLEYFVNHADEEHIEILKQEELEYRGFPPETKNEEVKFKVTVKINGDGDSIVESVLEEDLSILKEAKSVADVKAHANKLIDNETFYGVLDTFIEKGIVEFVIETTEEPTKDYGRNVVIEKISDKIESDFYYDEIIENLRELKPTYIEELKLEALKETGVLSDIPELKVSDVPDNCFDNYKPQFNCTVEDIADVLYDRYYGKNGSYEKTEEFVEKIQKEGYHYDVMIELVPDKVSIELYVKEDVFQEFLAEKSQEL